MSEQMYQLGLEQISEQKSKEISKAEGDWKQQLEILIILINETTKYQRKIRKKFGSWDPQIPIHQFQDIPYAYKEYYSVSLLPTIKFQEVKLSLKGVALLHGIERTISGDTYQVHYKSELHIDEQYFLSQMIPNVSQPVDPIYPMADITINVPKKEMIKESIFLLNKKLTEKFSIRKWFKKESNFLEYLLTIPAAAATGSLIGATLHGISYLSLMVKILAPFGIFGALFIICLVFLSGINSRN